MSGKDDPVPQFNKHRRRRWVGEERRAARIAAKRTFLEIVVDIFAEIVGFAVQLVVGLLEGLGRHL